MLKQVVRQEILRQADLQVRVSAEVQVPAVIAAGTDHISQHI